MSDAEKPHKIEAIVGYLPAPKPYKHHFEPETTLEAVRADAMTHFKVENYEDRNKHEFFLDYEGERITDYSQTLEQLLGEDNKHETVDFELVEQVTAGER